MSALDMSLEDVIKSKGGNSKRTGRAPGKAPSNGVKKVQNTERPKRNTSTGIATALKAAAAAAAAASKPAPAVSKATKGKEKKEGEEKSEKPAAQATVTPGKAPKGPGGASGTEDKLGMTLDDVIRVQDTKKKVTEPSDVKRGLGRRGGFSQRFAGARQGVRKTQTKQAVRNVRGRGARQAEQEDSWGGNSRAWDAPSGKGKGKGKGKGGKGSRRASDDWDWGPPAKRARADDWDDWSWGGSKGGGKGWRDEGKGSWRDEGYGYGKGGGSWNDWGSSWERPRRPSPMLEWDRAPPAAPVQRVLPQAPSRMAREERLREERLREDRIRERAREERLDRERAERERLERAERAEKTTERSVRKTIRVCNVPKNLEDRDIKEAFEDIGRVTKCDVERGVAVISFANSSHAKKAVQTFDRGELNGQTIYVSLES